MTEEIKVIKQFLRYVRHIQQEKLDEFFAQEEWEILLESSDKEYESNIALAIPGENTVYSAVVRAFHNHRKPGNTLLHLDIVLGENQSSEDLTTKLKRLGFEHKVTWFYRRHC